MVVKKFKTNSWNSLKQMAEKMVSIRENKRWTLCQETYIKENTLLYYIII